MTLSRQLRPIGATVYLLAALGAALPAGALPLLNEVLYDGPGGDADDVFTELVGEPGSTLDGWHLAGINGADGAVYRTLDLTGAVFPADGVLVIATGSAASGLAAVRDFVASVDWQNGPDAVQLLDPLGQVVDALQYGVASGANAGEGNPAEDVPAGASLSRDRFAADTGDNATDFRRLSIPTPGTGPLLPVAAAPEPPSAALLGAALLCAGGAGMGRRTRRRRTPR